MLNRRTFLASAAATVAAVASASNVFAADFSWDGTWSGKAANGRLTSIRISKGKVLAWYSNDQPQKIASSSVGASKVSIAHAEGAKVTLTPKKDGTVSYSWKGSGAQSSAILRRR